MNKRILTEDENSIIALATPRGSGAIAILRLSGTNALSIVSKMAKLSSGEVLENVKTHTIHHGFVIKPKTKKKIDEVLFFVMKAPRTYTGQNTVEISCHNNSFIIETVIDVAIGLGANPAKPGEFTKRAFLNNKLDLIQAESINELINAQTVQALKRSFAQVQGSLSHVMYELERKIVKLLGYVEASFEFFEEEQKDFDFEGEIKKQFKKILEQIDIVKSGFNKQKQIRDGIKIAILGFVNVGKSTLFNSLLNKERAIVTKIEGTTRDSVESSLYKNGIFWLLVDTAGFRQTKDFIEQEGIKRSWQEAKVADIILVILDATKDLQKDQIDIYKKLHDKYKYKILFVLNKIDLVKNKFCKQNFVNNDDLIKVSARNKIGIKELESKIQEKVDNIFKKLKSPYLLNIRQYNLLLELENKIVFVNNNLVKDFQYELIAIHLKEILVRLSELTGKNVTEKVLDEIFNNFCVGK